MVDGKKVKGKKSRKKSHSKKVTGKKVTVKKSQEKSHRKKVTKIIHKRLKENTYNLYIYEVEYNFHVYKVKK